MKKLILLLVSIFLVTGCVNLNKLSYDEIIVKGISKPISKSNIKRVGYSYALSSGLKITNQDEFNEVIESERNVFYLYVDLVSYFHKSPFKYNQNTKVFYSKIYENNEKKGYLEINEIKSDKYLIEIMYNYAKIEVIVDEADIKLALVDAISILSSITYNDNIINNLMKQDILNFSEEEFNIFETAGADSNVLEILESDESEQEEVPDTDLVN